MFQSLTTEKHTFRYNNKDFDIYNEDLIEGLLGAGRQNPVNIASSAWKKEIVRHKTNHQRESITLNPKYLELKRLVENYVKIDNELLSKGEEEVKKILSENLKKFKKDGEFRKEILKEIANEDYRFKKNINMKYFYILFSLHVALYYNYFTKKEEEKFLPIVFSDREEFNKKYFEILNKDDLEIDNLTSFSYNQYFWIDYRLSETLDREIHTIIYNIFLDINKVVEIEKKEDEEIDLTELKFDASEVKLRTLLSEEIQFIVPDYQREYSWEHNKEVKTFLKDFFEEVFGRKIKKYFLGSIVLIEDGEKLKIIDGQQRITTILIMLSILREFYSTEELKETLNKYVNYDFKEGGVIKQKHKLTLNKNNEEFFRKYITSRLAEGDRGDDWKIEEKSSNELINKSYREIKKSILTQCNNNITNEHIEKIEKALLDNFYLIKILVPNEQMANKIFETLNDRGKPLKVYENIKNYIFGRVSFEFEVLRDKWNELVKTYGSKHFENYIIQVYKSNYVKVYKNLTRNNFFTKFKANSEIKDYHKFVAMLEEEIAIFKNLLQPDKTSWEDKDIHWNLKLIEAFEVNSVYLTLLSSYVKDFYFRDVLKSAVKAVFRNEFSLQKPYDINVASTKISKDIRDFNDEDIQKKRTFLEENVENEFFNAVKSNDDLIKSNFLYKKIYDKKSRKNIALKLLTIINKYENTDNSIDWSCFTTEHMFSQTESSSEDFKKKIKKIETDYEAKYTKKFTYNQNSIYNLTLLPEIDNGEASHSDFEDKIEIYKKYTNLPTNKKLVELYEEHGEFNLDLIEEYQKYLWEKVKEIFYLD